MALDPMAEQAALGARELLITRMVKARREVVWRLWTDPDHLAEWWGPHGFTNPECSIEPWAGGELRILMRSPDGEEYLNVGTIQEAEAPKRLVFTIALLNRDGSPQLQNLTTVDLADRGEATDVTVQVRVLHATTDAGENPEGMRDGWSESLEKLAQAAEKAGRT